MAKKAGRKEQRSIIAPMTTPATPAAGESFLSFLSATGVKLPSVTLGSALKVPAVLAAITFLARTLSTLDLNAYRETKSGPEPVGGRLQTIIRDAPNSENSGYASRNFFWTSLFSQGRGLQTIVRDDRGQPIELWSVNPGFYRVTIDTRGRRTYTDSTGKVYPAADIIDVPFYLREDQVSVYSPIQLGEKAIQLAIAMNDFGSTFFAGGGMPPLAVEGPMPAGAEARARAMSEINRAIDEAKASDRPLFATPPGFSIKEIGYDPQKGQMVDGRRFQIEEIARLFQIPPMFLQDLTRATFSNSEAQDLFLVKHLLAQWAKAYEDELNLKLFGQLNSRRFVRHDFDSILRGDFATRMDGLTRSIQGGIRTPNEARLAADLPRHSDPAADQLFMQGATIPLDQAPTLTQTNSENDEGQDDETS